MKAKLKTPVIARRSSSTSNQMSPQIEFLQDFKSPNQSTFFKTFQEMPNINAFARTVSRISSPRTRLHFQLQHNQFQCRSIVSSSQEKQKAAIDDAIYNQRNKQPKIIQKVKRRERDQSPKKAIDMKFANKVFQVPKLDVEVPEFEIPTIPTFFLETQRLVTDVKTFKPSFVEGAAISIYNDYVYLYGGIGGTGSRNKMMKYDLRHQIWTELQSQGDVPKIGRSGLTVIPYKNKFIYFGGSGMFNQKLKMRECSSNVYEFLIPTSNWTKLSVQGDQIEPRRQHKSVLIGSKWILIYGGVNSNEEVLSDTFTFNIEKQVWKQWDFTSQELCSHALVNTSAQIKYPEQLQDILPSENIYCFGGKDQYGIANNIMRKLVFTSNHPDGWEVIKCKGQPPAPIYNHTMEYLKRLQGIAIIGGMRDHRVNGKLESDEIFMFYPTLALYQQVVIEGYKQPRCAHMSCVMGNNRVVIFGGIGNDRYIEPDISILETDMVQVQQKIMKDKLTKKVTVVEEPSIMKLVKRKSMILEEQDVVTPLPGSPIKNLRLQSRKSIAYDENDNTEQPESPSKKLRNTIRRTTVLRTFLPAKRQVLIRYDLFIGLVKHVMAEHQAEIFAIPNQEEQEDIETKRKDETQLQALLQRQLDQFES